MRLPENKTNAGHSLRVGRRFGFKKMCDALASLYRNQKGADGVARFFLYFFSSERR